MQDQHTILQVPQFRRLTGAVALLLADGAIAYSLVTNPPANLTRGAIFIAIAIFVLWFAWRFWRATENHLILTKTGLFDSTGLQICLFEQIAKVDRGILSFKPSSGFLLRLKTPVQRRWAPGLWWSFGKFIGVGGATDRRAGKHMADEIALKISEHSLSS